MSKPFFRSAVLLGLVFLPSLVWSQTLIPRPDPRYATGTERQIRRWALLIGVGSYSHESAIRFALNDVKLMESTLVTSGDFHRDQILVISDNQPAHLRPTAENLEEQIPRWLGNVGRGDSLLVYFSGHGDIDSAGNGVLCPTDYDRSNPHKNGFSMLKLRELLVKCAASEKVLLLDCCHAGANKAVGVRPKIGSSKLLALFQNASRIVTLASCRDNEFSYEDERQGQGVFTSNVVQALRGGADLNRDGIVDSEELFDWCSQRVPAFVQKQFNADQHPIRLSPNNELISITRTQYSPTVDQLVARKENGVFRIECYANQNWTARGTAFAIAHVRGKLYLVTTAGVVEDDDGRLRANEKFRLQCGRLLSIQIQPTRILIDSDRRQGRGPDVAILEINWAATNPVPALFNLKPSNDQTDLRNRECAFLAFPNRQEIDSFTRPEYASGRVANDYNARNPRFGYVADYPNQADGAPLFVVDDQSEQGRQLQECVVGITSSNRYGDNRSFAESIDVVWKIISDSMPEMGFSILPVPNRTDGRIETKLTVPNRSATEGNRPPEVTEASPSPTVNWQERIDRSLKLAVQEGRSRNWDRGAAYLEEMESQLAREGLSAGLPWEFYSLRGVLLTHRGFEQNERGHRQEALRSFTEAWDYCHHGWKMAPEDLYAQFMLARVYNNLGTPNPGKPVGPKELEFLKWTHDRMSKLAEDDNKGIRILDPRHRAQCEYLLGYIHDISAKQICSTADGRNNYQKSWEKLRSKQVAAKLKQQSGDTVDIWNEYDELLQVWERRRSTVCKSCQVAQKCETCN